MPVDWDLRERRPAGAQRTVLLLPGGMCSAGSYAEVMAEPELANVNLIAATFPGQVGTPPPDDCSVENYARLAAELAAEVRADVVVGFSMGAVVAVEMVTSGAFAGPVVLLGVSLSTKDEPAFFRGLVASSRVLGGLPFAVLARGAASMVKRIPASDERRAELRADFAKNVPRDIRRGLQEYVSGLRRGGDRAERLCRAGVPMWLVHAEKGDGGLTDNERRTLEGCPHAQLVTISGHVFFLPNEIPDRVAQITTEALKAVRLEE
jgi:pimeloyl-ACP methyl ester carboxylesterase